MKLAPRLAIPIQCALGLLILAGFTGDLTPGAQIASNPATTTPIKHVIIVIGKTAPSIARSCFLRPVLLAQATILG